MSDSTKTTQQSQSSQTTPWAPAQGLLSGLIGQYSGLNPAVTAAQGGALTNLSNSLSDVPNFGAQGAGAVNNLFNTDNSGQVGMLNSAYGTLQNNLGATASGANLNPYSTPGFSDAINTAIQDATNSVKGVYAGSGRDPSGAGSFAQSLGRGITQGISPTIASQYNTNYGNMLGANSALFSGAGQTASGVNSLNQQQLTNGITGLASASAIPGLYSSPAAAQYAAANQQYSQPFSNLTQLLAPSIALGSLGKQSVGASQGTETSQPSLLDSIMSGFNVAGRGASSLGAISSFLASDERVKEDIVPVGRLNDGQNVYSYRYRGSPTPQIGLLAQEVQRVRPEAVAEVGGVKFVNYDLATRGSRVGALEAA